VSLANDRCGIGAVTARPDTTSIELQADGFQVDASLVAEGLGVEVSRVPALLRSGEITSVCERGVGDDEGRYRLTFFHRGKRLRLVIDEGCRLIRRSIIDFGDHPRPVRARGAGGL
jgi:hypothetical protein